MRLNLYQTDKPCIRRALDLWLILALAVSVKTFLLGGGHSVFRMFVGGSVHWWADKSLYADYSMQGLDSFRYSPAFAVAFTPLAETPDPWGAIAWNLLSLGMLVWALRRLVRDVLPGQWPPQREAWLLGLTAIGTVVGVWALQTNALLTAMLILALSAIARGRWWVAAAWLAGPVFIKIWPLALVMLLVIFWPRQLIWRLAVVCAILALLPFLTRPPQVVVWQYQQWYAALTGPLQGRSTGYRDAWTIYEEFYSLCHLGGHPVDAGLYNLCRRGFAVVQLATALGVFGWCAWQRRRTAAVGPQGTGRLLMLIFSMWACWQLFCGPGTEQLTYGLIAPTASWAVVESFSEKRGRVLSVTAWAMLALLPSGDIERAVCRAVPGGRALLPLGVLLMVAWLVWRERGPLSESHDSAAAS